MFAQIKKQVFFICLENVTFRITKYELTVPKDHLFLYDNVSDQSYYEKRTDFSIRNLKIYKSPYVRENNFSNSHYSPDVSE
ncbi:unnamed protein product [Acanthoscelides obtectus]|uniref:Uncharacterized protein n=1 Tax=Acanthoscelides obtectus TaxID=200917 RepID=A0A9P0JWD0_ACAOB|nr:unnamed protein product [Acanthoscelides obtectus]CAK1648995.1 hypothetical protein AOBTE_LOCUS15991 [Acanthoscelides obtectus]